jgi:hypothetical protein
MVLPPTVERWAATNPTHGMFHDALKGGPRHIGYFRLRRRRDRVDTPAITSSFAPFQRVLIAVV